MNKITAGIAIAILLFPVIAVAQPETIVVGCGNFRPMFFQGEGGQASGRDVDLWRLWSQKTGITVEFRIMEWADVIPALLNGEIDVVNGASYTPERAESMAFTEPHQNLRAYLFFHQGIQPPSDISDLGEQNIGVLKGSNIEELLRLNVPKVRIVPFPDYESLAAHVLEGQLKIFIAEEPLISYYLTMAGGTNEFRRSANIVLDCNLCMAVRLEQGDLLDKVNQGFAAITKAERRQIDEGWFGVKLDDQPSHQWHLWLFLLLGIGIATSVMMALARTWEKEILNIQNVRVKFINMWIVFAATIAPFLFLISMMRVPEFGWLPLHSFQLLIVFTVIIFAVFRNHIHYYVRTLLVLASLYFLGLGGLLTYGIVGSTQLPMMTLVIVAVLLFGMKGATISIIVSLATIGSVFLAIQIGIVAPPYDIAAYSASLGAWSLAFVLFGFYAIGIGLGIAGVYRHMENALRAQRDSESLFRNLVETTSDLIWETNASGDFVYCSPQFKSVLGYTPEEALGKKFYAFMPPEEKKQLADTFRKFTEAGKTFTTLENANLHKDGRRIILESSGVPVLDEHGAAVGYRGVARDVTERKKGEEERERLMFAIEQAAESIIITDALATVQYVNPAFENTTGYERDEIIGKNLSLLKNDAHDATFYKDMWKTLVSGESWSGRMQNKKKNGALYTGEVVISPVRDTMGIIVNFIGVQRDITNEIKLEEQLRQAQKMEAVGQLAGGVAHDFNNLLQAIMGYGDLAMDEVGLNNPAYGSINEIMQASKRAATLVRQLLAFSRRQVLEMSDISLNEVIANLAKMIRRVIGEHIVLEVHNDPEVGTVHADAGQMEQVLMNLCVNARDAMPEGGTITITTKNITIDEAFCETIGWDKPGRYVCLCVADTGCGMDEDTCSKIFEPFFTTKEVGKGTGLGLSTVYGIAKQHEGFVHVSSEVGKGTTFSIYLPLVERSATAATVKAKGPVPGGTEMILIAEDDGMVCRLSETVLKRSGYTVLTAADGAEAMKLFQKHASKISLVLLDVIMPKLSGLAVFEQVREARPDICVLFSSGYSIDAVHAGVVFNERTQMIQKPYHPDDLLRKVREVLDGESA